MTSLQKVVIENRDIPILEDDEVLVQVEYVGICGSDLHYFESGRIGDFVVKPPFVLGHEAAGTVVETGKNVKHLKKGDRVCMEPGKTCGVCEFCKSGRYNLCKDVKFFATPPVDGVFQEYVAHEAGLCFLLPDQVSTLEGALIEPLAVGLHAANQGNAHLGQTAVVTGKNVKHLKKGDRVCMEPGKTCGVCEFCKSGRYNLCKDVKFFATPPVDGVFQEYVAHEAGLCFLLPDQVSTLEGALIEPLAVGMHAANQGNAHLGQTAVVTGAGCIGLTTVLSLKAMGVSQIIVVDIIEKRLQKALEVGATAVINGKEENTVERMMQLTEGRGFDLGIETAGTQITATQLIQGANKGATIVFVGYSASGEMTLPIGTALDKELTFKTVFRYRNIYPMAIEAVASGKIDIQKVVTDYFELDDIQQALTTCVEDKSNIVKGIIKVKTDKKSV